MPTVQSTGFYTTDPVGIAILYAYPSSKVQKVLKVINIPDPTRPYTVPEMLRPVRWTARNPEFTMLMENMHWAASIKVAVTMIFLACTEFGEIILPMREEKLFLLP